MKRIITVLTKSQSELIGKIDISNGRVSYDPISGHMWLNGKKIDDDVEVKTINRLVVICSPS